MKKHSVVIATAALLFTACGSDATPEHAHSHDDRHDHGMSATDVAWGEAAEPSAADRTIEVAALDYRFEPAVVRVASGDTVTFVVTNEGDMLHEFFLGTAKEQLAHGTEMAAGGMHHHDSKLMVEVPPGETKELTWIFTRTGTVQFACHIDDHFARGMVGAIEISD